MSEENCDGSHRIVSLLPSATDHVASLGCLSQLVGRSHECDDPPEVTRLPVCSAARIDIAASSREINRTVTEILSRALSIFEIDTERLVTLQPTVILTQAQCEVCAVSVEDVEHALAEWIGERPQIVSLSPQSLNDVWNDLLRVSQVLGVEPRGIELVSNLKRRLIELRSNMNAYRQQHEFAPPRVACIEWIEPLMTAGNWVPELVELAGGINVCSRAGVHSPWLRWENLLEADPDLVVVMPCGFDLNRIRQEIGELQNDPHWWSLRAVRQGEVYLADGHHYFNRPSAKLVESAEILTEIFRCHLLRCHHGKRDTNAVTGADHPSTHAIRHWERLRADHAE
ncbi:MAG: cobalamin-binding protein [Planctomycetaceae bacterium]